MEDLTFKHNGEIVAVVKPTGHVRWIPNSVVIPEELQAAVRLASQQQRERPEKLKSDYFLWGYLMANIGKDKDSNVNQSIVIDFECVGGESEADLSGWLTTGWKNTGPK